jgi:hypothetical protein
MRSRNVGGTNRPCSGASASGGCSIPSISPIGGSGGGSEIASWGAPAGSVATAVGASGSAEMTASTVASSIAVCSFGSSPAGSSVGGGVTGLTTLTRRGGPRTGAAGFGGSDFLAADFFPLFAFVDELENMSPLGSATFR